MWCREAKAALPGIAATLPKELEIKPLFDQSVFVSTALADVGQEAIIAASLTAAMILLFLGSWRSTVVVATSIPLSICCSILALHAIGSNPEHHDVRRPGISGGYPRR